MNTPVSPGTTLLAMSASARIAASLGLAVLLTPCPPFVCFGAAKPAATHHARDANTGVGLPGFEPRPIGTLSVCQFERDLLAPVLRLDAALVLLHEPFAAIDSKTVADLM